MFFWSARKHRGERPLEGARKVAGKTAVLEGGCRAGEILASGPASARSIRAAKLTAPVPIFRAVRPSHFPGRFFPSHFTDRPYRGRALGPQARSNPAHFPFLSRFPNHFPSYFLFPNPFQVIFRYLGGHEHAAPRRGEPEEGVQLWAAYFPRHFRVLSGSFPGHRGAMSMRLRGDEKRRRESRSPGSAGSGAQKKKDGIRPCTRTRAHTRTHAERSWL